MKTYFYHALVVISIVLSCIAMVNSCHKEKKTEDQAAIVNDPNANKTTSEAEAKNFKLENWTEEKQIGKTLFQRSTGETFLSYNTVENTGIIKINGKTISLEQLIFSENNFIISGQNIHIIAQDGAFQEEQSECITGYFPSIQMEYNHQKFIIKEVHVINCPEY